MRMATLDPVTSRWGGFVPVGEFNWRFTGCPHCGGGIASASGKGRWKLHSVVWTGQEVTPGLFYLQSDDQGRHWKARLRIGDGHARDADIAAWGQARAAIVFTQRDAGGTAIRAMRSGDGGTRWSQPLVVSGSGAIADHPRVIATDRGLRAFWTEYRSPQGKVLVTRTL
jgi:hypothetical protein